MQDDNAYPLLRQRVIGYADEGLETGQIYEKLEANEADLVDAYIQGQRRQLMVQAIWTIVGHSNRRRRHAAIFADSEDRLEAGESLLRENLVGAKGRKSLMEMTKEDLVASAEADEQKAQGLITHADFKRSLARKVPKGKTVGDVFTPEQIARFMQNWFGDAA